MKTFAWAVSLLLLADPAYAQDCGADWKSGTGTSSPYWLVVDGLSASRHSNLATGLRALKDTLSVRPDAAVRLRAEFEGAWLGSCGDAADTTVVVDTLPPVQDTLPPVQDTVVVEVCPDDWTCILPGSEPPPAPTMYVAGYADTIPGTTDHGLHVAWEPMAADSFRVVGSKQDGSDEWTAVVPGADTVYRHELTYDTVTAMQACVSAWRGGLDGPEDCDEFEWAPMAPSDDYELLVAQDGSRVRVELRATSGAWDAVPRDDSQRAPGVTTVEFEIGGETTTENWFPYVSAPLPPGDHVISWRVNGENPASGQATVTVDGGADPAPSPDPPSGGTNEPTGMTELFGSIGDKSGPNFANEQPDSNFDMWGWRGTAGNPKAVSAGQDGIPASAAAVDPENFWIGIWPEGHAAGQAPFNVYHSRDWTRKRARSMYWRFYFYLPSGFQWHQANSGTESGMVKGWWFTHGGHANHFVPMRSSLGGDFGWNDSFGLYMQFNRNDVTRPAANLYYGGISTDDIPRDEWVKMEFLFVANSAGNANDGKYRCWMNGEQIIAHDDVHYFSPLNFELGEFFNRVSWNPTWGGGGDVPVAQRQVAGLDDWYVSFSRNRL